MTDETPLYWTMVNQTALKTNTKKVEALIAERIPGRAFVIGKSRNPNHETTFYVYFVGREAGTLAMMFDLPMSLQIMPADPNNRFHSPAYAHWRTAPGLVSS